MSGRVEKLLKAYPEMIQKRDCLAYQLAHFKGLSAEDVIDSMMTPKVDGERVKSSRLSDKTAQIALEYRDRQARFNREWYEHLEQELLQMCEEFISLKLLWPHSPSLLMASWAMSSRGTSHGISLLKSII